MWGTRSFRLQDTRSFRLRCIGTLGSKVACETRGKKHYRIGGRKWWRDGGPGPENRRGPTWDVRGRRDILSSCFMFQSRAQRRPPLRYILSPKTSTPKWSRMQKPQSYGHALDLCRVACFHKTMTRLASIWEIFSSWTFQKLVVQNWLKKLKQDSLCTSFLIHIFLHYTLNKITRTATL